MSFPKFKLAPRTDSSANEWAVHILYLIFYPVGFVMYVNWTLWWKIGNYLFVYPQKPILEEINWEWPNRFKQPWRILLWIPWYPVSVLLICFTALLTFFLICWMLALGVSFPYMVVKVVVQGLFFPQSLG
jgi:hypothetical protein